MRNPRSFISSLFWSLLAYYLLRILVALLLSYIFPADQFDLSATMQSFSSPNGIAVAAVVIAIFTLTVLFKRKRI